MIHIPGGIRYTPADTGFDGLVVNNGVNAPGNVIPWRAAVPFSILILRVNVDAGTPNFIPRMDWFDLDGQTVRVADSPFINPASTSTVFVYWCKDNQPRALASTPTIAQIGVFLGAPYARLRIHNQDTSPATFTVEAELLRAP